MQLKITFLLSVLLLSFGACKEKHEHETMQQGESYYTCPMHPSVISPAPGSCPVCNMSLIKVEKQDKKHEAHQANTVTLDNRQQLLAGIQTDTVKFRNIIPASTILGTVALDEEQVTTISSRVKGRIDKLHVKTSGDYISQGQPVYEIYSEQLFADEKEFISLAEKLQKANQADKLLNQMLNASENKLLLWGLNEKQINELKKNKIPSPLITFYSPSAGYVTNVQIKEGMYVEEGTSLIKLVNLKQVWVEAQVYADETTKMSNSASYQVFSETTANEIYNGQLVFSNPVFEQGRKIQLLRIKVENKNNKLIPGMMVYVSPKKNTQPVLSVPKSAVLLEKMKTVWIKTDENTFEQRMIQTGTENKYFVEIISGIKEGETIVSSGAYLISSEFILKSGAGQRHNH